MNFILIFFGYADNMKEQYFWKANIQNSESFQADNF